MTEQNPTILVVDDNPDMLESTIALLNTHGYKNVSGLPTADTAIEQINTSAPDIVITDGKTGSKKNGVDVVTLATERGIKSIMLTGTKDLETPATQAGVGVFLIKASTESKKLPNIVRSLLAGNKSSPQR